MPGDRKLQPAPFRPGWIGPDTLFSFFPDDYLLFVDESHVTVPQIRGMFAGDHNRKVNLVEHGFRPPSADNRPLKFDEWEQRINQVIYVSATPGPYELGKVDGQVVEQVIRPTGLLHPEIEVCRAAGAGAALVGADSPAARRLAVPRPRHHLDQTLG